MIDYPNFDDYKETCECGKFPVTNIYIDAWQNVPLTACEKIVGN